VLAAAAVALMVAWISVVVLLGWGGSGAPLREAYPDANRELSGLHTDGEGGGRTNLGERVAKPPGATKPERETGTNTSDAQPAEEGVGTEPGGHDPLGVGAGPGELSPTERGRAKMAAFHFVRHAYDRPGNDHDEYLSGVTQAVVSPEFFGSPGGKVVGTIADRVAVGGVDSPAAFEGFEARRESLDGAEGMATFRLGGDRLYEQELELVRWGATWRVISAGEIREAGR